jgi:hypothetical protein
MLVLTQQAFDYAFGATFTTLLEKYDDWSEVVVLAVGPLVHLCADWLRVWFDWPLTLHPHWKHIMIVLSLYMTNYISNNVSERPRNAVALAVVLVPLAALGAAGFGLTFERAPQIALLFPVLALVLFAIAASASTTLFHPPRDQGRWATFRYYWVRTVMPFIVFGGAVVIAAFAGARLLHGTEIDSFVLTLFAAFVLALAVNLLIRGPSGAEPQRARPWRHWFSGSFGPRLGTRIVSVYALAALQFLLDRYLLQTLGL